MEANEPPALAQIGPLREAGFALHWLHPRTKRPIGNDWSDAAVATLDELRRTYAAGNNLGVRLGEPSHLVGGGYLHVLDADIRLTEAADEAWAWLDEMFQGIRDTLPMVQSGSGGESRHLYFVADRPFYGKKLAVSEGKHRRFDHDRGKEVWSYDWEIELFGTGKQVAMPPSLHPDTGNPYVWLRAFPVEMLALGLAPTIPAGLLESLAVAETTTYEFESRPPLDFEPGQLERDLADLPLAHLDDYHDWVMLGQALHHQFGAGEEGFGLWLEQSKRSEKFDATPQGLRTMRMKWRSFGRNRRQPVSMGTIRQWAIDARSAALREQFADLPEAGDDDEEDDDLAGGDFGGVQTDNAAPSASPDPLAALIGGGDADPLAGFDTAGLVLDWISLLDFNADTKALRPTLHNVKLVVRNDPRVVGLAQRNDFTCDTVQRTPPGRKPPRRRNEAKPTLQLEGPVWDVTDTLNGDLWDDDRDFALRAILEAPPTQGGYGMQITDRNLKAAVELAASDHAFHPVREYLASTAWDGKPRVETLFIDYFGAADTPYSRDVGRLMMVAAVARIFEPGHKFDFAVILEGLQGKRKSTFIEILGRRWFAELDGDFHDPKQMIEMMQGAWIMELPELTGFQRSDVRAIKAFISRKKDRARLAYARRAGEFPRQCIFIGSTNDREYLKDDTGGRRFWPMPCAVRQIDTDRLERAVDQLWAEALHLYREMRAVQPRGTLPLYLTDPRSQAIAARLQESRRVETADDALAGQISVWLDKPVSSGGLDEEPGAAPRFRAETCHLEIWCEAIGGERKAFDYNKGLMIGRAMKLLAAEWESDGTSQRFAVYGKQRVYRRVPGAELASLIG